MKNTADAATSGRIKKLPARRAEVALLFLVQEAATHRGQRAANAEQAGGREEAGQDLNLATQTQRLGN